MQNSNLDILILAAGHGRRMRSTRPKPLQHLGGRPLLVHIMQRARALGGRNICIIASPSGRAALEQAVADDTVIWCEQPEPLGTGHAAGCGLASLPGRGRVLIMNGDSPLIGDASLQRLCEARADLALLTAEMPDPTGHGRILRNADGQIEAIVEEADATPEQRKIRESSANFFCADQAGLGAWIRQIQPANQQGEYYLPDIVRYAYESGASIAAAAPDSMDELLGANDHRQLAALEAVFRARQAGQLLEQGVTVADPARVDVRGSAQFGRDCEIDINVILQGHVQAGDHCRIGAHCVLEDVQLGDRCDIAPHSVLQGVTLGDDCQIGPFARLCPDTELGAGVQIGNFVETKRCRIGAKSKVKHLSYVADSQLGQRVNVGAGAITCNYDGNRKHNTEIADDAFIGSNVALVAPIKIGQSAAIGAGSAISGEVAEQSLAVTRAARRDVRRRAKSGKGD